MKMLHNEIQEELRKEFAKLEPPYILKGMPTMLAFTMNICIRCGEDISSFGGQNEIMGFGHTRFCPKCARQMNRNMKNVIKKVLCIGENLDEN